MDFDFTITEKDRTLCINDGCIRYKSRGDVCEACYLREYRNSPKGRRIYKNQWLQKLYGITIEDFEEMLIVQDYQCAICNNEIELFGNKTNVDHCHKTGIVRGLLCSSCNSLIALAKESKDILTNAINYLNR